MATASPEPLSGGEVGDEDAEEGVNDQLRDLSDQVLKERLQRVQDGLDGGFAVRLPDGGKKYRLLLRAVQHEIARRQAARTAPPSLSSRPPPPRPHGRQGEPEDNRCERIIQSRCAESCVVGLASDSNENHGVTKSDFLAAFDADDEEGIDVSEITSTNPGKPKTSVENEGKLYEVDESCKTAAQPTYLSPKVSCIDNSIDIENMSSNDDCKDNGHCKIHEHASTPSQKRKGDSVAFPMRLRSRKITFFLQLLPSWPPDCSIYVI